MMVPILNDSTLSFDDDTMYRLTHEEFNQLTSTGEVLTGYAPAKNYSIDEDYSRLFLSFDNSLSNFFFEFEPEQDINTFIMNACLTQFFPKTGKLKLLNGFEEPLGKLLPKKRLDYKNIPQFDQHTFKKSQQLFADPFDEIAIEKLITTGHFKGQLSCCNCGEPGCSSEYLWAEDYYGLASFHIQAAGLYAINLFPFKLSIS